MESTPGRVGVPTKYHTVDSFNLRLVLAGEHLVIEAKPLDRQQTYSLIINNDLVGQITSQGLSNVQSLYNILLEGLTSFSPDAKITISKDARLSYSSFVTLSQPGMIPKELKFDIQLLGSEPDPSEVLQLQISSLSQRISELEKKNNGNIDPSQDQFQKLVLSKLENIGAWMKRTDERLTKLEKENAFVSSLAKRISLLEDQIKLGTTDLGSEESFNFDPSTTGAKNFSFSDDFRSILSQTSEKTNVFSQQAIPKDKRNICHIKLERGRGIVIGITPSCYRMHNGFVKGKGIRSFDCAKAGVYKDLEFLPVSQG